MEDLDPIPEVVPAGQRRRPATTTGHQFGAHLVGGAPRLFISLDDREDEGEGGAGAEVAQFSVNEEVIRQLAREIPAEEKLHIVSIAGPLRTGKSFLMNRLFDEINTFKSGGFALGPTMDPCTKGIWIWVRRIEGKMFILLDTEGLFSTVAHADTDYDNKILTLALLLSSSFVWNNTNVIDRVGIEKLGFVAEVSRFVRVKSQDVVNLANGGVNSALVQEFFPLFWWVIRDHFLELTASSEDEYLENQLANVGRGSQAANKVVDGMMTYFPTRRCQFLPQPCDDEFLKDVENHPEQIKPTFLRKLQQLVHEIRTETPVMRSMGVDWSASLFGELARSFVESINSKQFVHVDPCFNVVRESANNALIDYVVRCYGEKLKAEWEVTQKPMTLANLLKLHLKVGAPLYRNLFLPRALIQVPDDFVHPDSAGMRLAGVSEFLKGVQAQSGANPSSSRVDQWTVKLLNRVESEILNGIVEENRVLTRAACMRFLNAKWQVIDTHIDSERRYFPVVGQQATAEELYARLMADRMEVLKAYDDASDLGDVEVKGVVREEFLEGKKGQLLSVRHAIESICENIDQIVQSQQKVEAVEMQKRDAEAATQAAMAQLEHLEEAHASRIEQLQDQMRLRTQEQEARLEEHLRIQALRLQEASDKRMEDLKKETEENIRHLKKKRKKERERDADERQRLSDSLAQLQADNQSMQQSLLEAQQAAQQPRESGGGFLDIFKGVGEVIGGIGRGIGEVKKNCSVM